MPKVHQNSTDTQPTPTANPKNQKKQPKTAEELKKELSTVKGKLTTAEKSVKELQGKLDAAEKNGKELQDKLTAAEKNGKELQDKLTAAEKNGKELQDKLTAAEAKIKTLEAQPAPAKTSVPTTQVEPTPNAAISLQTLLALQDTDKKREDILANAATAKKLIEELREAKANAVAFLQFVDGI
ncbi:hypothetical protein IKF12_00460 [Candidatus Saccharibacteria bacterium]|nr:hypothetical protein [Candidatus Saccharibacteria bacterium]